MRGTAAGGSSFRDVGAPVSPGGSSESSFAQRVPPDRDNAPASFYNAPREEDDAELFTYDAYGPQVAVRVREHRPTPPIVFSTRTTATTTEQHL